MGQLWVSKTALEASWEHLESLGSILAVSWHNLRCSLDSLGASWEHVSVSPPRLGSVRRVPKGAPGRQKGRPGAPGSAPRRPKSTPSRVRERQAEFFACGSFVKPCRSNFSSIFKNLAPSKSDDVIARNANLHFFGGSPPAPGMRLPSVFEHF